MKNLLKLIIIFFIISSLLIFPACRTESVSKETISTIESTEEMAQETTEEITVEEPEEEPAEEVAEAEKLQKIDSLLASEAIRWNLSVNGIVQEIENRNVTIVGLTERGEETASLVVPISQEAKIISDYILPEGASKEEITGRISIAEGKEYNLGEKEIRLEEINVGDDVFISLNLKPDYTIEGIQVRVSPVDLFYDLKK